MPVLPPGSGRSLGRNGDFLAGIGALVLSALFAPWWFEIRAPRGQEPLGPALLPAVYLLVIAALGAMLIVKAWLSTSDRPPLAAGPNTGGAPAAPSDAASVALRVTRLRLLFVAMLALYIWVLPAWGFFTATTALVTLGVLALRRGRVGISVFWGLVAGAALAAATLFIFGVVLLVDLPVTAVDEALMGLLR